jgi:hypothetical protein
MRFEWDAEGDHYPSGTVGAWPRLLAELCVCGAPFRVFEHHVEDVEKVRAHD